MSGGPGEYRTLVTAALLHDIGKLLQRGSFGTLDIKGKHPQVSADFVSAFSSVFGQTLDPQLLKTLVQHHHESSIFPPELRVDGITDPAVRALATIVSLADHSSASERGERAEQYQDFKLTPLASVIQRVRLPSKGVTAPTEEDTLLHFRAQPLAGTGDKRFQGIFPLAFDKYAGGELNHLLQDFGAAFSPWIKNLQSTSFLYLPSLYVSISISISRLYLFPLILGRGLKRNR